ncbi:MAG: peptidyl-tRNA hydrolase Pth2 [Candidatus Woesearchaeota archaeon]|nr:peptidyl-tRNA hydrolase Pth2 [Candidatus Woesearchaeota archaeon]
MSELKQVILIRKDLGMSKGKIAAQAAHAAVEATLRSDDRMVSKWRNSGMKKITLKIESEKELYKYLQEAKDFGLTTALITDAGRTEIAPGTPTCLAIGPENEDKIDSITGKLSNF